MRRSARSVRSCEDRVHLRQRTDQPVEGQRDPYSGLAPRSGLDRVTHAPRGRAPAPARAHRGHGPQAQRKRLARRGDFGGGAGPARARRPACTWLANWCSAVSPTTRTTPSSAGSARASARRSRRAWPTVAATVAAIGAAGGVAVLAHPHRYKLSAGGLRELCAAFREAGGAGHRSQPAGHGHRRCRPRGLAGASL